jgi:LmbE family N-acetylglucosaminyl deacetylase
MSALSGPPDAGTRSRQPERVLVVVAHPDDIEYGTAAAVDVWTSAGVTVTYLLATRGEAGIDGIPPEQAAPLRAQEEVDGHARSASRSWSSSTTKMGSSNTACIAQGHRARDPAAAARPRRGDELRPVFAGGMTNQADHRAVGLALIDAVRDAGNRWIFRDLCDPDRPGCRRGAGALVRGGGGSILLRPSRPLTTSTSPDTWSRPSRRWRRTPNTTGTCRRRSPSPAISSPASSPRRRSGGSAGSRARRALPPLPHVNARASLRSQYTSACAPSVITCSTNPIAPAMLAPGKRSSGVRSRDARRTECTR